LAKKGHEDVLWAESRILDLPSAEMYISTADQRSKQFGFEIASTNSLLSMHVVRRGGEENPVKILL
jgi:hypothetical protein